MTASRRLILFRHARAANASRAGDFERQLTPEGRADAARIGRALAAAGLSPHRVLVSPALRTRETWEAASGAFEAPEVTLRPSIYDASAATLSALADEAGEDGRTLMIVGHNPGLHTFAMSLAPGAAVRMGGFPPAAAACFLTEGGETALERYVCLPGAG